MRRGAGPSGVVIGSPVISASFAFPLKQPFDALSNTWGQKPTPLEGKAVVMVRTSVNAQHFLALNDRRKVSGSFFAAHVLPPGLHLPHAGQVLCSLPGVATRRAAAFAAFTLPIERFATAEHLYAATGLAPTTWQSSSLTKRGAIRRTGLPEHRDAPMAIA